MYWSKNLGKLIPIFSGSENTKILLLEEKFTKTASGKTWKKTPEEKTEKEIKGINYLYTVDSIPFFKALGGREIKEYNYTKYGYIITRIISTSPDRKNKIVRSFTFI